MEVSYYTSGYFCSFNSPLRNFVKRELPFPGGLKSRTSSYVSIKMATAHYSLRLLPQSEQHYREFAISTLYATRHGNVSGNRVQ